jgi:ubiquinone/menaquinone biosynthesis C-methylase UbiE
MEKRFWEEGAGFFGRAYIEGDDSLEGYLTTPLELEERTSREISGIIKLLDLNPPQSILDCPCGYGRHSIQLARMGFEVVGSDINGEMLEPAIHAARGLSNIRFEKQNMQHLTYDREFDAVLNLFFSFGFFETDEENNDVLRRFYKALKPGGKFMMHTDINLPRIFSGKYKFHELRQLKSGRMLEINESYDPEANRLKGRWALIGADGSRQECPEYNHIIYTYDQFASICREAGFEDIKGYGGWDGSALTDESEDMIVVATRPR